MSAWLFWFHELGRNRDGNEMERKVWADKEVKGQPEEGSRQGHRCDTAPTMAEVVVKVCTHPSWAKLSPSCLLHLSIKRNIFL